MAPQELEIRVSLTIFSHSSLALATIESSILMTLFHMYLSLLWDSIMEETKYGTTLKLVMFNVLTRLDSQKTKGVLILAVMLILHLTRFMNRQLLT